MPALAEEDFVFVRKRRCALRGAKGAGDLFLGLPPGAYDLDLSAGAGVIMTEGILNDPGSSHRVQASAGAGALTIEDWTSEDVW